MAREVTITIRGDDQASKSLNKVARALRKQEGAVEDAGEASAESAESSSVAAGGFSKMNVAAAAGAAALAGIATAAVGAKAAISKMGEMAVDRALQVDRMSNALGIATETFSEFEHAAKVTGAGGGDDVADAIGTITDRAEDAKGGMQSFIDDFALVGLEVEDLRGKNPEQLFRQFSQAVADTEDPNKRATAALRILGDDLGRRMLPLLNQGEEGLEKFGKQAREMGLTVKAEAAANARDFNQSLSELQGVFDGVFNQIGSAMLPALTSLIDAFKIIIGPVDTNTDAFREMAFDGVQLVISGIAGLLETLNIFSPILVGITTSAKQQVVIWKILWNTLTGITKLVGGLLLQSFENILIAFEGLIRGGQKAAEVLGRDGMAASLRQAGDDLDILQGGINNLKMDALEGAQQDVKDIGSALKDAVKNITDMPGMNKAITNQLAELQDRVEEADAKIRRAREAGGEEDDTQGGAVPSGEAAESEAEATEEAEKGIENEERRNRIAEKRMEILRTESKERQARLQHHIRLLELQDKELTKKERQAQMLKSEKQLEEDVARAQAKQDDGDDDDPSNMKKMADAMEASGARITSEIGNVLSVIDEMEEKEDVGMEDALAASASAATTFADQFGASAELQAAIMATFETAMGFATMFSNPAESAAHFIAAANFGAIAVTGAGGDSSASGGKASVAGDDVASSTEDTAEKGGRIFAEAAAEEGGGTGGDVIHVDFSGATMLESAPATQNRIEDAVKQAKRRKITRGS